MKLNSQEQIDKIWKAYFGDAEIATDPFGRSIVKKQHGTNGAFSWEVDHIWPKNPDGKTEGANVFENVQPLNVTSNREKANVLQGRVLNKTFAIHKVNTYENKAIGRMAVKNGDEWVWGYDEPRY